ncbi:hypothetical protein LSAT2_027123 [Lamellibrachia satsuma]|nr:hypothetical protein LSAT2_027123 [Lamellibrachia satsuma]
MARGLFQFSTLRKSPDLAIMPGITLCTTVVAFSYLFWSLFRKPDVRINHYEKEPRFERVTPSYRTKVFWKQHSAIPELEKLRKEIGTYKYK